MVVCNHYISVDTFTGAECTLTHSRITIDALLLLFPRIQVSLFTRSEVCVDTELSQALRLPSLSQSKVIGRGLVVRVWEVGCIHRP